MGFMLMMRSDVIIEMHSRRKKLEGIITIASIVFVMLVIVSYLIFLKKLAIFQDSWLTAIIGHIKSQIVSFSILGSFYTALFGGLFFIWVPMEGYFIKAMLNANPALLYILFIIGIIVSYSIDYMIGLKLSRLSRKLVSPKKFYKIKTYINRYGKAAIFLASAIPFMPSQQVTFILGVFRYNKLRLFILTLSGQMLKYLGILAVYRWVLPMVGL